VNKLLNIEEDNRRQELIKEWQQKEKKLSKMCCIVNN